jgi:protein gp37
MGDKSKIEWLDGGASWNPITGCTPISEGCANCYARTMAETRLRGMFGYDKEDPFKITYHFNKLEQPLKWKKPRKIFVCSMGDLFHAICWLGRGHQYIEHGKRTPYCLSLEEALRNDK